MVISFAAPIIAILLSAPLGRIGEVSTVAPFVNVMSEPVPNDMLLVLTETAFSCVLLLVLLGPKERAPKSLRNC